MMETAPVLRLTPAQVLQLIAYCTQYRAALWQNAMPTPERNQLIRNLQAFLGRLEKAREQAQAEVALLLTAEEKYMLQQLFSGLIRLYGMQPTSEQRNEALKEVAECRLAIQRMWCQGQPLEAHAQGRTS